MEVEACDDMSINPCCSPELEKKPQYRFKRVLTDNSFTPFRHFKLEGMENETTFKQHPYEREIMTLLESPPALPHFATHSKCPEMGPFYEWVDTEEKLTKLAQILRGFKAFAVDTEQHSVRSFLGFTALMQISTGTEDFLVDTIALHDVMGILRPIFSDPSICKVFHGADNDVLWLQRDFHIYVVNLFDTAKACGVLFKKQKSLAFLLDTYCRVTTNKSLQLEDWRTRPLSEEMVHYARVDAHYLLFIAHCLYLELDNQGLVNNDNALNKTYRFSNEICMQLYCKEIELPPGNSAAASIFSRFSNIQGNSHWLNDVKKEIIRRLCTWREITARIHDESLRYVLPDQAIVALSLEAPTSTKEIIDVMFQANFDKEFSNFSSTPSPSSVIKGHIDDISCLLGDISEDADGVFQRIFRRQFEQMKRYQLSLYNYAILFELNIKVTDFLILKNNGEKYDVSTGGKASGQLSVQKFCCKAPVYQNCKIYANDGRLLCYCSQKKLEWYLRRDCAKIVEEDPLAIMFVSELNDYKMYDIQSKKNICVGCGEKNHYSRYGIIPSCYRIHIPKHLKINCSHDIVLLCVNCRDVANAAAERYKGQVADEFGIPLFVKKVVESSENGVIRSDTIGHENGVSPVQLRLAAKALYRHGSKLPEKRHKELIEIVKAYFGRREITKADIETAFLISMSSLERRKHKLKKKSGMTFRSDICEDEGLRDQNVVSHSANMTTSSTYAKKHSLFGHGPHGKQVVEHILTKQGDDGILQFCQRWRQVFVDSVCPRFLHDGWDIKPRFLGPSKPE